MTTLDAMDAVGNWEVGYYGEYTPHTLVLDEVEPYEGTGSLRMTFHDGGTGFGGVAGRKTLALGERDL